MAPVTLTHVSKSFGAVNVLSDISLDIADGEFVVLVGPSGCGKSTLLRCIAGLEEVTGGEIRIGERVVNDVAPRDRDIAMVFQSYALYPHMDVARNMSFGLILRKEDPAKIEARVGEASGRLGLGALLARLPKQLSGGQRQRVAMGRAIVRKPSVFLFDEPLSNLDAKLRAHMRTEIKALHQQLATTAVYVTHDQIEAMTMASRIVVMNEGLVQQVGPPLELYDRPANLFVAGFIGSPTMNFMEGIIDSAESPAVRLADGELLPVAPGHAGSAGQAVVIGCRPEHMTIGATGLAGEVRVVEPLGMMTQLMVRLGGNALAVIDLARRPLQPGDRIALAIAPERVHIFDRATSRRLN